ncbi:MAG: gamma-glutamyltransferase [Vicinamibacterales bacterium]
MTRRVFALVLAALVSSLTLQAGSTPARARRGMVVSQNHLASDVGWRVIERGGNAVDAAVATALALAVTHPTAGNIGGGGFLVFRAADGQAVSYDFREAAPAGSNAEMWLTDGKYDFNLHHNSHRSVGVPGTVAGLHLAWKEHGSRPWKELVEPAVALARDGFEVSIGLARSLAGQIDEFKRYPASLAQFTKNGTPYEAGDVLKQPDLARTLQRIADAGPAGFYEGETAALIEKEMQANDGLITRADLRNYQARRRDVVRGQYRGYEIIGMAPPSSGGIGVIEMLNILEGYDLKANGYGSARNTHLIAEAMRRSFADRAQYLGDPDFVTTMPIARLISKEYGETLRKTINPERASTSSPTSFTWPTESQETTHFSVVDTARNAVSVTYTLEYGYGSRIVMPRCGVPAEQRDGRLQRRAGVDDGAGPDQDAAEPGTGRQADAVEHVADDRGRDNQLFMVTGSPGGRTIINTVLTTIINAVDFGMNAQEVVDAGRMHHQWLPDRLSLERYMFSADVVRALTAMGHTVSEGGNQGVAEVIIVNQRDNLLEGGVDRRAPDGGAAGR